MFFPFAFRVHIHDPSSRPTLMALWKRVDQVLNQQEEIMAMLDDLKAAVEKETTAVDSAVVLIKGLAAKLQDAITAATDLASLQAGVQGVIDEVTADTGKLSEAVAANTVAAPVVPDVPAPVVDPPAA